MRSDGFPVGDARPAVCLGAWRQVCLAEPGPWVCSREHAAGVGPGHLRQSPACPFTTGGLPATGVACFCPSNATLVIRTRLGHRDAAGIEKAAEEPGCC